ncbi:hypothetical protein PIROE2DRAFT_60016 [Piromyces sp. E2]|nr:hypothetical protein PIROE2DRAFT_60016 [Piromyces sp. E2]|eukprot:OUM65439.1 hypothetical protein PIROE2DRAFT_60016 [Piromyces sp. E2]
MSGNSKKDFLATVKSIKFKQQRQISLIQNKAEEDSNLLNNLITYLKKKVEIEREYNKAMEKNNKVFLSKIKKSVKSSNESLHSNSSEDTSNLRLVQNTFNVIIKESQNLIEKSQNNCEAIQSKVINVLQDLLKSKDEAYKKKIVDLTKIKDDIFKTYENLERTRLSYETNEKDSQNQKSKYEEACTEPKGALGAMKNMLRSGDSSQRIEKYHQKWETAQLNSTNSRNEYLVYIDLINLQNQQYYDDDCPKFMKAIDDNYYESMTVIYDMLNNLNIDYAQELNSGIKAIQDSISKIDREADNKLFITQNDIYFKKPEAFVFEPYGSDNISSIILNDETKHELSMLLEIFNKQLISIEQNIEKSKRELKGIEQLILVYSDKPSFGNADESINASTTAAVTSTNVVKRKPVQKTSSSSSLSKFTVSSVVALFDYNASDSTELNFKTGDVIEVIKTGGNSNEKIENQWWTGKNKSTGQTGQFPVVFTKGWESAKSKTAKAAPKEKVLKVKALYNYEATCEGELTITVGDIITVTNTNTGSSSWWEGTGPKGHGQFPSMYVKELTSSVKSAKPVQKKVYNYLLK